MSETNGGQAKSGEVRPNELEIGRINCDICTYPNPATHVTAQSSDEGVTRTWVLVCVGHAEDWNDGHGWIAPVFKLGERIE
jgi:hypothetical protein